MEPLGEQEQDVLYRAREAGVQGILVPGVNRETSSEALRLAHTHSGIYSSVGYHPSYLSAGEEADSTARDDLVEMALDPRAVAIGETGLDLHHFDRSTLPHQLCWLRMHAQVSCSLRKTLIVHSRKAEKEVANAIADVRTAPVILHCYTGPGAVADSVIAREDGSSRFFGFTGSITYRSSSRQGEVLSALPGDRVLIETDAPFMSPSRFRGRPCEPSFLPETLSRVASLWREEDIEAVGARLWDNSERALQLGRYRRTDLVYRLGGNVYVNVTGRCNNNCRFCVRRFQKGIGGYHLDHGGTDPDPAELEAAVDILPDRFDELVFCGYGEPTLRYDLVQDLAKKMKGRAGWRTRLNTNGLMLSFADRETVLRLLSTMDSVSVSLNCQDAETYRNVCRTSVENAYENVLSFIGLCVESGVETRVSAVRFPGVDLDAIAGTATRLGVQLRIRG